MTLEFRNYKRIAEGNLEHIRGDIWDIEFLSFPSSVYNPGLDLLKVRLTDFDPGSISEPATIEKTILGHTIYSPAGRNSSNTDITFTFNDREDQSITYMVNDYRNQMADPDTGFGRHKSELVFDCRLIFYNTLLVPVREILYDTCIYATSSISNNPGAHGEDLSQVTLTCHCQNAKMRFL